MELDLRHALAKKIGFTLVELMIVVSIIGILASIAIPQFADMIRKSQEGATKGSLGAVRSALNIYYADMEGQYPSNLYALTSTGKYLTAFPTIYAPYYHSSSNSVWSTVNGSPNSPPYPDFQASTGLWVFLSADSLPMSSFPSGPSIAPASVFVGCTHTDTKGTAWDSY
jgi:general secretion pathway protein G